jgi:hypothetical protein
VLPGVTVDAAREQAAEWSGRALIARPWCGTMRLTSASVLGSADTGASPHCSETRMWFEDSTIEPRNSLLSKCLAQEASMCVNNSV